ncbi:hypothetical protein SAMN04488595_103167 [Ralstonia sp. 25mfcol4.1]|nr:hypothetical protein SAMN04488595_103167 [Ralstonia sp. 25mfcol4.1]
MRSIRKARNDVPALPPRSVASLNVRARRKHMDVLRAKPNVEEAPRGIDPCQIQRLAAECINFLLHDLQPSVFPECLEGHLSVIVTNGLCLEDLCHQATLFEGLYRVKRHIKGTFLLKLFVAFPYSLQECIAPSLMNPLISKQPLLVCKAKLPSIGFRCLECSSVAGRAAPARGVIRNARDLLHYRPVLLIKSPTTGQCVPLSRYRPIHAAI